jgi:Flp pilus assembly pilin Flp
MKFLLNAKSRLANSALHRDERGLSTVEYVILLALIAVAGITAWGDFSDIVVEKVDDATAKFGKLGDRGK